MTSPSAQWANTVRGLVWGARIERRVPKLVPYALPSRVNQGLTKPGVGLNRRKFMKARSAGLTLTAPPIAGIAL
jgi:hypothetical protein